MHNMTTGNQSIEVTHNTDPAGGGGLATGGASNVHHDLFSDPAGGGGLATSGASNVHHNLFSGATGGGVCLATGGAMGLGNLTGQQVMDNAYLRDNHLASFRKAPLSLSFAQQRQSQRHWLHQQQ